MFNILRIRNNWALQYYAWAHPQIVKAHVEENDGKLAYLCKREVLKNMYKIIYLRA